MQRFAFVPAMTRLTGIALLMAAAPAQPQEARDGHLRERDMLEAHNLARDQVGLPPLIWNESLVRDAEGWANHLAQRNLFDHASPEIRKGQGENLWRGTRDRWSPWEMIGFFLAEKRDFRPGNFPEVSHTGRWSDVGHYTQIIWPDTREVGCAIVRTASDEVLVCRYWPAGNVWGQRIDPAERSTRR